MEQTLVEEPVFVGRRDVLNKLKEKLKYLKQSKGSAVFIGGEAGIGKTRLVEEFIKNAGRIKVIRAWCLPEQLEPLFPVKVAFRKSGIQHLIEGKTPPLVLSVYLINRNGILISKVERTETNLDPDIFASMLKAVSEFVKDSLSMMDILANGNINVLGVGKYKIIVESNDYLSIAVIIKGEMNEMLINDMRNFLSDIGEKLQGWDGTVDKVKYLRPKLGWFIKSGKYDGKFLVDDPKVKQQNIFDNILLGFKRLSMNSPLIFFIDDLQWADPTTLALLHYLSRNLRENRVMIIGTYRPEDISGEGNHPLKRLIANMSREGILEVINLDRIDMKNVKKLVKSLIPQLEFDEKFLERIYQETGGVPFFVIELIKYLIEKESIVPDVKYTPKKFESEEIPTKIKDVVKRRLDILNSDDREILECASVIGEEFPSDILAEVLAIPRINLLRRLGLIERKYMLIHYSQGKYRFDHAIIREILYNEMGVELRREYHRMVADTLVESFGESIDEIVGEVAYHYYMAGDMKASKYLIMAGDRAKEMYANEEAVRFYSYALKVVTDEERIKIYEKLGDVYLSMGEFEKSIEYYDRVIDGTDDNVKKAKIHRRKAVCYERLSNYNEALKEIETSSNLVKNIKDEYVKNQILRALFLIKMGEYKKGLPIAEKYGPELEKIENIDEPELADLYTSVGSCFGVVGNYKKAMKYFQKSVEICERSEDMMGLARAYYDIGIAYHNMGELDKAKNFYEKCLEINENIGAPWGLLEIYNNMGTLYRDIGNYRGAMEYYKKSLNISEKIGSPYEMGISYHNMGFTLYCLGMLEKSLEYYEKSLKIAKELNDRIGIALNYYDMGTVYHDFGDYQKAMELYKKSEKVYNELGDRWGLAYLFSAIGCLLKNMEKYKEAGDYLSKSMELAKSIDIKEPYLMALICLGELHIVEGMDDAEDILSELQELTHKVGIKDLIAMGERVRAMHLSSLGKFKEAEDAYKKAISMFQEMGAEKEISITAFYLSNLLHKKGDPSWKKLINKSYDYFVKNNMRFWANKCKEIIE